jgi:hypothetical protein
MPPMSRFAVALCPRLLGNAHCEQSVSHPLGLRSDRIRPVVLLFGRVLPAAALKAKSQEQNLFERNSGIRRPCRPRAVAPPVLRSNTTNK